MLARTLLVAWLIKRHFGEIPAGKRAQCARLLAAAGIGPAVSGSVATVGFILYYHSGAPVFTTWLNWFASDASASSWWRRCLSGSPACGPTFRRNGNRRRYVNACCARRRQRNRFRLAGAPLVYGSPSRCALPVLLAAHCRPVFAAAAALILGFAVVWTTTFGIGDLGDLSSLQDRAYAARSTLLAISICTLLLAALFAERRYKEAALKDSNGRLQLALDGVELGVWSMDARSGRFESDVRDRKIHGHPLEAPPQRWRKRGPMSIPWICHSSMVPLRLQSLPAAAAAPNTV